jgi:surfeit locus 1 family protein
VTTRSRRRLFPLAACALLVAVFSVLALWQWQRLQWKEALLARVALIDREAAAPAPGPQAWASLRRADDEYRALALQGRFDPAREQLVLASTVLGRGHWVMAPLLTGEGWWVWVNRGFVDDAHRDAAARPAPAADELARPGLLRLSERPWLPGLERASRDVARLSAAAGLPADRVAPYFVDARPADGAAAWPRAGLTVLSFTNRHLGYALTWAALALATCAGAAIVWRHSR